MPPYSVFGFFDLVSKRNDLPGNEEKTSRHQRHGRKQGGNASQGNLPPKSDTGYRYWYPRDDPSRRYVNALGPEDSQ